MVSWDCLLASRLKIVFHWKAHSLIFFKSSLSSPADTLISWITENNDVSSATNLKLDDKLSDKSLNNNGPNTDPYGTPARANFKHLLRTVPTRSALLEKWNAFFFTKTPKTLAVYGGECSVLNALNLKKWGVRILNWVLLLDFCFLFVGYTARMPLFSRIGSACINTSANRYLIIKNNSLYPIT